MQFTPLRVDPTHLPHEEIEDVRQLLEYPDYSNTVLYNLSN